MKAAMVATRQSFASLAKVHDRPLSKCCVSGMQMRCPEETFVNDVRLNDQRMGRRSTSEVSWDWLRCDAGALRSMRWKEKSQTSNFDSLRMCAPMPSKNRRS